MKNNLIANLRAKYNTRSQAPKRSVGKCSRTSIVPSRDMETSKNDTLH